MPLGLRDGQTGLLRANGFVSVLMKRCTKSGMKRVPYDGDRLRTMRAIGASRRGFRLVTKAEIG